MIKQWPKKAVQVCVVKIKYCVFTLTFVENYWNNVYNRRKFFIEFASQKGFDPLVAANWKNVRCSEMIKQVKEKKKHEGEEIEIEFKI